MHDSVIRVHGGTLFAWGLPRGGAVLDSRHRLVDIQNDGLLALHGDRTGDASRIHYTYGNPRGDI